VKGQRPEEHCIILFYYLYKYFILSFKLHGNRFVPLREKRKKEGIETCGEKRKEKIK